jgi:hypothetical protein
MELLLLLLLVPVIWLMLLPSRIAGTVRRHRVTTAAVLTALAIGGLLLLQVNHPPAPAADYAEGDATLRAMLE